MESGGGEGRARRVKGRQWIGNQNGRIMSGGASGSTQPLGWRFQGRGQDVPAIAVTGRDWNAGRTRQPGPL